MTEVQREAKRIFRPVQAGKRVQVTEHGKPIASIIPDCAREVISLKEFFNTELTDQAIIEALKESQP